MDELSPLKPAISSLLYARDSVVPWTPWDVREYLESREGRIWQHEDTLRILERAEQIEALLKQLMRAAGVEIVE
jgi:hypothetical protein